MLNPTIFERDFCSWVWGQTHLTRFSTLWPFLKNAVSFLLVFWGFFCSTQQTPPPPLCAPGRLPELKWKQSWTESSLNVPGNILHMPTTLKQTTYVPILNATQRKQCSSVFIEGERTAGHSVPPTAVWGVCDSVCYDITDEVNNVRTSRAYIAYHSFNAMK